jgi:hypothetical protein
MWKQKNAALAIALIMAGLSSGCATAQGSYDQYGNGPYANDQYGADPHTGAPYNGAYDNSGTYDPSGAAPLGAAAYDSAGYAGEVNFDYFHDALAPHGQWFSHSRWGDVWRPINVSGDFRPYYQDGYWANTTEYGWSWVSDHSWGDIAFHYGRWVNDPYNGWLWVPGYVWGPSWVIWRSSGDHLGWFPMPPTDTFLLGVEVYDNNWRNWDQSFGYTNWYGPSYGLNWSISQWVFVDQSRFGDRDFRRWVAPRNRVHNLVRNSRNITNYVTENNYISNHSLRGRRFNRGRGYDARPARNVFGRETRRNRADAGRRMHQRERRFNGGNPNASARERLASLPRGDRRNAQNRLERRRAARAGQEPRVRDQDVRAGRTGRDANARANGRADRRPNERRNERNGARANRRAGTEQTAQQPRTRNENMGPQRPRREAGAGNAGRNSQRANPRPRRQQAITQPPARDQNVRPQRPGRDQTTQQSRTRNQNVRTQRAARTERPQRAERAQRLQRERAARQTRADNDNGRTERPARGRRNRGE